MAPDEDDARGSSPRRGPSRDEGLPVRAWEAVDASGESVGELRVALSDSSRFGALCRAAMAARDEHLVAVLEVREEEDGVQCWVDCGDGAPLCAALALAGRERVVSPRVAAWIALDACRGVIAVFASVPALGPATATLSTTALRIERDGRARLDPSILAAAGGAMESPPSGADSERGAVRALGELSYELVTGARPRYPDPTPPGEILPAFPEAIDDMIVGALRASEAGSTATLAGFAEGLEAWLEAQDDDALVGGARDGEAEGGAAQAGEPDTRGRAAVRAWLEDALARVPSNRASSPRPPSLRERLGLGRMLDGKYRLDGVLGSGGMGVVFAGTHLAMGRAVAVKVLVPRVAGRRDLVARFLKEGRVAGGLHHPGLVAVHDVGEHEGAYYLVTERLEGETLRDLLDREGALPAARAVSIALHLAAAIAHAHDHGVIHRDLKPENVFLQRASAEGRAGKPKLLDFGISKDLGGESLTFTGAIVGTPLYLAPEQVRSEAVDARTDIYQLGALLFEMLTGEPLYQAPGFELLLCAIVTRERTTLEARAPHLPAELARAVEWALSLAPAQRPPDVRSFARRIAPFAPRDPALAQELGLAPPPRPRSVRLSLALAFAALTGVCGALGGAFIARGGAAPEPSASVEGPPQREEALATSAPVPERQAAPTTTDEAPLARSEELIDAGSRGAEPEPSARGELASRRRAEPSAVHQEAADTPAPTPLGGELRLDEF